ncbi:protein argonaute 16 [Euphorbia lathyris]|uniref:protein argonaute 16 n=1 Tax=Euphorbia lathyris TaxID=212925 RepID=UPI00331367F4
MEKEVGGSPPPPKPTNVKPKVDVPNHSLISRNGFGTSGHHIPLLSNHFKVSVNVPDAVFYHYNVSITSDDKRVIEGKRIGRKLIDRLYQTYSSEFCGKQFAYDGEKSLYTVGPLPQNKMEFSVVLEEAFAKHENGDPGGDGSPAGITKRSKCSFQSKIFIIEISYAAKIPFKPIAHALRGVEVENISQDALRVLDIVLRQQAANRGCLLVRQSFFHDDSRNFIEVGGGATGVQGFHSSFRTTQGGLSLNMDVSTTMILTPGPVIDFLKANQNVRESRYIDWVKAKKMLKNLRVKTRHRNMEYKILGLTEKPCNQQYFPMKVKNTEGVNGEPQTVDIAVSDYFSKHCGIELTYSTYLPCLDVGKPKRPNYLPLELCSLVSLQRYTKALSSLQRASLVEKSRQKPQDKIKIVTDAMRNYRYDDDPVLSSCGVSIEKQMTHVDGRVLETPKLKVGNSEDCVPRNGRWNFNNKTLWKTAKIHNWAVVNFSARCDTSKISRDLIDCGRRKGIQIERPYSLVEEEPQSAKASPFTRVEKMFERIRTKFPTAPRFILCVLAERKNSDIYGPWKKECLSEFGIATQCISPLKITDQYLTNVLLKINSKLGGINSLLAIEHSKNIPLVTEIPTMILGMDVSHGSPGCSDVPSVAAVVGSRQWPLISRYRASVRTQSPKLEMIDALYKPLSDGTDDGIMSELLLEFYQTSNGHKPKQIIIFRDGVSDSQFNQVLNIEVQQIIKAYQHLGGVDIPKFTVIVAQKNHRTKLFRASGPENIPPGTVVDTKIVHPTNYDFYMCAHPGILAGTSRPAHYHVLLDEIGFSPDDLQNFVHSLSYVYQRSTTAISIAAPVHYAHLAAKQMGQFLKFEDLSETSSGQVPELPRLHKDVVDSMFFC